MAIIDEETRQAAEALAAGSLDNQSFSVRSRRIQWESYEKAGLITKHEAEMIILYDRNSGKQGQLLAEKGSDYAALFLTLITKITNENTLQYLLTLIVDLLTIDPLRAKLFHNIKASHVDQPYGVLLNLLLNTENGYLLTMTTKGLSALLLTGPPLETEMCDYYMKWLANQVMRADPTTIQPVIRYSLMELLRHDYYRLAFYKTPTGVQGLCDLVTQRAGNFQMQYQVVFCLWCLTFNRDIASTISRYHISSVISGILTKSTKEKVVRVSCATLKNLLTQPHHPNNNDQLMIANGLLKTLRSLLNKNWKDDDLVEDLTYLVDQLVERIQDMSSYDEYAAEIQCGSIKWSAVHRSEGFWRENVMRFNEDNHKMLGQLIHYLEESCDPLVLAVCAHDVGEYVSHYHRGRSHVEKMGGKEAIIGLLQHPDNGVRYEALVAIQKMMVQNWYFLNKQTPEKASASTSA